MPISTENAGGKIVNKRSDWSTINKKPDNLAKMSTCSDQQGSLAGGLLILCFMKS